MKSMIMHIPHQMPRSNAYLCAVGFEEPGTLELTPYKVGAHTI
jgi:hypothetical protein